MRNVRVRLVLAAVAVLALVAAGCGGGGDDDGTTQTPAATAPAGDAVNLAEVCPNPIVIQTDWDPESEYGVYYHMLGPSPKIDTQHKRVTGPLVVEGKNTGVQLEVRTGGPSIGFEPVSSQMYKDTSITLGQVSTDEAIRFSAKQATLAVVAPMEISPFMIMWDPGTYPQFNIIADIGQTKAKVRYFKGDTYMEYLVGSGIIRRSQLDDSYDGSSKVFYAAKGKITQAGFATSEPYLYSHDDRWGRQLRYALVNDTGYPFYPQALSIRSADKQKLAPCLRKLVPVIQRSVVGYLADPKPTNDLIVKLTRDYDAYPYSAARAAE